MKMLTIMKKSKIIILICFLCFCVGLKAAPGKNQKVSDSFSINARVFIAGSQAKKQGAPGMSQLTKKEKASASYLPYNNYKLLTSKEKSVSLNQKYVVNFNKNSSLIIIPQKGKTGRLKIRLQWCLPGKKKWEKTLFFKKNSKTLIGGPKFKKEGNYLLSLEIK